VSRLACSRLTIGLGQQGVTRRQGAFALQKCSRCLRRRHGPQGGLRLRPRIPENGCHKETVLRSQWDRAWWRLKRAPSTSPEGARARAGWRRPADRFRPASAFQVPNGSRPSPCAGWQFATRAWQTSGAEQLALQPAPPASAAAGTWAALKPPGWAASTAAQLTPVAERSPSWIKNVSRLTPRRSTGLLQGLLQPEQENSNRRGQGRSIPPGDPAARTTPAHSAPTKRYRSGFPAGRRRASNSAPVRVLPLWNRQSLGAAVSPPWGLPGRALPLVAQMTWFLG